MRRERTSTHVRQLGAPRVLVTIALVALVALAGCGAITGQDTSTHSSQAANATESPSATATAGNQTDASAATEQSLPTLAERGVDVNATWNRTVRLFGVNATRPPVIVRDTPAPFGYDDPPAAFAPFVGPQPDETTGGSAYYHPRYEKVVFLPSIVRERAPAELESILVHEYVHAIQYQRGWAYGNEPRSARSEPLLRAAYFEGMAEHASWQYERAHLNRSTKAELSEWHASATTYERYSRSPYVHGPTYFENRLDDPTNLSAMSDDWPESWEQVLHDTEEGPQELSVEEEYSAGRWVVESGTTQGELVTRLVLREELPAERATGAAAGWGNDKLLRFESAWRNESGYVWIHRWDTSADVDEFADAMSTVLDARRSETDEFEYETWRLTPETTAVVAGKGGFVDTVDVGADSNATVTASVPD